jgi:hypothetical protein
LHNAIPRVPHGVDDAEIARSVLAEQTSKRRKCRRPSHKYFIRIRGSTHSMRRRI